METDSLDDVIAWNEQLAALMEVGIPLDVGLSRSETSATQALDRINATIARRVNRGETLEQALEGDEQDVPAAYRSMVQFGLRTGDLSEALGSSSRVAESIDDSRIALRTALFYPLVLFVLAYLGLIGFCLFLVPTLEEMYVSAQKLPGPGLRVMQILRDSLPYWVAIPPIILLLAAWRMRNVSRRSASTEVSGRAFRWLPGVSKTLFQQRCARFATWLAALLDSQTPLHEALMIAGDASGDAELRDGAKALADAVQGGQFPRDDSQIALRFPPFLRWALWHADTTTGRAQVLQIASQMFRDAAERRTDRLLVVAPIVGMVLIGGTVTLLYGLALFVPVVEMLWMLAR